MHEMQTIVTNVHGVCLSVSHVAQLGFSVRGSFGAAFAKSLWPPVPHQKHLFLNYTTVTNFVLTVFAAITDKSFT